MKKKILVVLCLWLLAACASAPTASRDPVWIPTEAWWAETSLHGGTLAASGASARYVKASHARNLLEAARRLRSESGLAVRLALADSDELNAFAATNENGRIVTMTLGLLEAIGDDKDALATTLGHEIAHLHYAHGDARRERNPAAGFTYVYGTILGLEGSNVGAAYGAFAISAAFTRFEEREADVKGMEWAVDAGFSPCGSARTMRILSRADGTSAHKLLATHPGHDERIARAHAMSKKLTGNACLIL